MATLKVVSTKYRFVHSVHNNISSSLKLVSPGYSRQTITDNNKPVVVINLISAYYYASIALENILNKLYKEAPPWNNNNIDDIIKVINSLNEIGAILFSKCNNVWDIDNDTTFFKYQCESIKEFIHISSEHGLNNTSDWTILDYIYEIIYQQGRQHVIKLNNTYYKKILMFYELILQWMSASNRLNIEYEIINKPQYRQNLDRFHRFLSILTLSIKSDINYENKKIIYDIIAFIVQSTQGLKYLSNQCNILVIIDQNFQSLFNDLKQNKFEASSHQYNHFRSIMTIFISLFDIHCDTDSVYRVSHCEQIRSMIQQNVDSFENILKKFASKQLWIHCLNQQDYITMMPIVTIFFSLAQCIVDFGFYDEDVAFDINPIFILKEEGSLQLFVKCIFKEHGIWTQNIQSYCLTFFTAQINLWAFHLEKQMHIWLYDEPEADIHNRHIIEDIIDESFIHAIMTASDDIWMDEPYINRRLNIIYHCILICAKYTLLDSLYKILKTEGLLKFIFNSSDDKVIYTIIEEILNLFSKINIKQEPIKARKYLKVISTFIKFNDCRLLSLLCKLLNDDPCNNAYNVLKCVDLMKNIAQCNNSFEIIEYMNNKFKISNFFQIMYKLKFVTNIDGKYVITNKFRQLMNKS